MTTIAYKDGVMAGDRQQTCNGVIVGYRTKIHKHEGCLIGCCGDVQDCVAFVEWFKKGCGEEKPQVSDHFTAMVIYPDTKICMFGDKLFPHELGANSHAIGSGCEIAIGAMAVGANPIEALAVACKIDTGTGCDVDGDIDVLNIIAKK
ncbi:MAG: hypothetical protein JRL30_28940 [Deltaproteobacteria bacterium]|nr:hypothetical protein [Deltaproteobacteria bacterium]